MKVLLILLVVANGVAFAWWNGWWVPVASNEREPGRMQGQIAPEAAKLVPMSRLASGLGNSSAASSAVNGAGQNPTQAAGMALFALCIDYPPVLDDKANEIEKQLQALAAEKSAALKIERLAVSEGGTYLVFLSPSATLKEAQRKLFELRRVGVGDVALIAEGDLRWGISVGLFSSDEAAKTRIQQLSRIGIPGAKVGAKSPVVAKVVIKARVSAADLKTQMLAIAPQDAKVCAAP